MPQYSGDISRSREIDSFQQYLLRGRTYYIELEGYDSGVGTLVDPYLYVHRNGSFVASDNNGGFGLDARLILTPAVTGIYTIDVESFDYDIGSYRLRVNQDDFRGTVEGAGARGLIGNTRGFQTGEIDYAGDRDIFATQLIQGLTYTFFQWGAPSGGGTLDDPFLRLFDGSNRQLALADNWNGSLDSALVYRARDSIPHFLQAGGFGDFETGSYEVSVSAGRATARNDRVNGSIFADEINGLAGADAIRGFGGSDWLYGAQHDDHLRGGSGYDVLQGGRGADVLIGGIHSDTFVYNSVLDSTPSAFDVIRAGDQAAAFQLPFAAGGDVIDLFYIDANATRAGNQAFAFDSRAAGGLSLSDSGPNTLVRGNIDRDAAFEFLVRIEDGAIRADDYSARDFFL